MEAMNGLLGDGEKGVAQPPSPLTGCYLLIVVGEPCNEQHKDIILQRITKGLLSWDVKDCMVDLEKELAIITEQALDGEEARYGERLIQFASENLVTEILIHPAVSTLVQCMRNLLGSFTRHRHIIHAGYTFAANGSWALQDGTFSYSDFSESFQEIDVQRILHAYENGISLDLHCSPEGDWPRLPKEPFAKACRARINPADVLGSGSTHLRAFLDYLAGFLRPATLEKMLASSEVVGNIRFSRPTLYVFPGGQGDAALFGINGFNMLLDGGFSRKACFWDFVRHLDRLDAVLLTRLNNSNVGGISSILRRKKQDVVYPQIGHFFCNIQERRTLPSPDGDKDKDPLLINLLDEGQEIISNLRYLNLHPQPCYRDNDPINLYHKVGHGTLDMYVLSPSKDSKEVKDFLHKWNHSDQKLFAGSKSRDFNFPVQNLVSVAALLVWQPANPTDTITRILFPGSSPQSKIFEGLDKLKSLECVKRPTCSVKSLQPLSAQKKAVIERITPKEKLLVKENKTIENNIINGDVKEKTVKKSDSTESDRSTRAKKVEESKLVENGDKPKPKPKPKVRGESQQRKKPPEKKASPTTPKKTEAAEARKPAKPSPLGTPAKSTKDANNRKVVESKVKREAIKTAPAKPRVESRPLAKKPAAKKAPTSPSKKLTNGVQKPDSISRKGKLDKEGTTDSSTVSTPSVDQESILKKELSQEDIQKLQAQELADLKEEQEAVKEIEAVFRKGESQPGKAEELRAVKDVSLEDKEEYIVIEKEVIEQESLGGETKEDEIQKLARDSEESEKPRRSSAEAADKEVLSPEDRPDVSSDKKTTDKEIEEVKDVVESHPDEKISANIKSGDTTTAPTLPEDERIPLDEIKEDGYAVEEKHVKEETKEKGLPVIQLPQKTFESVPKIPGAVGIRLDKQQLIRDIVKTPDEVADLPVHEEVDYEYTHELRTEPVKTNEVQEAKVEQQAQMVFPKEKQKEVELEEKDKDEVNNDAKEEQEELRRLTDAVHENEDSEKGTIGVGLRSDIKQKSSETKIEAVAEHGKIPTEECKIEAATIENIKDEGDQKDLQKGHTVEFEQKSHERREEELVGKVETESQLDENLVLEDPKSKPVEKEMPKAVETKTKTPEEEKEQVVVIEDREKEVQKEKTETEFTKNISVHETIGSYSEPEKQKEKVAEESGKTESKLDEHVSDKSKKITEVSSSDIKEVRHESVEKQLGINEAEEVISHAATSKTESEFKEEEESGELLHKDSVSDIKEETETASRKIVEAVTKTQTKQEEELVVNEDATKKKENEKIEPALDKGPIMLVQEKMSSDIPEKLKEQTQQEMPENEEKGITTITSEVPSDLDHGKVEIEEMETEPNTSECEKDTDNIVLVNKSMDNIQEPAPKEKVEAEKKVHSGDESEELEMVDQEALKKVTGTETIENKAKGDLKAEVPTALNEVKTKEQQEQEDEALADQEIAAAELKPQAAPEAIEKIELGRKSPKEREEDVIKIVASVAEVLKSDAPLEEFTGKLPINTFGSYTTELRETHITTMDSPLIETKVIKTDIPTIPEEPHTASASFIDEEIKAYTMQESEDKRISLLKESQEFMKATSKMLSDIKATTEKSIPTEEPDAEEKIDDDDVSTVHRMLVTASSEDGGEEIEICPAGSIIFSKSSESSGRSSPDPSQKTQKSSMVDTSESLSTVRQILDDQTQREIHGLASQEIENEAPKDKITEHEVKSGPQNIEETVVAGATKIGGAEIIEKVLQDEMSQKTIQSSEEKLHKEYATGYQLEDSLANENDAAEKDSEKVEVQQTRKESTSQLGKEELATIECQIEQKASMQENQEVLPNTPADVGQGKLSSTFKVEMPLLEDTKPPHPESASADQEQLQPAETQPKIQETEITMSTQSQAARPDVEVSKDSEETVEVSAAKDDHEDDKKDEVVTLQTSQKEEASPESTSLDHKLTKDIENEFYDDTEVVISKTGEQLKDIKKIGDKELLKDSVETTGSLEEHCGKIRTDSDVEANLKASKQITEEKGETEPQLTRAETESEHKISEATDQTKADHETDSFMKGLTATTSKVIANIFQGVENETKDKLDETESSIEILQTSVIGSATKIDKDIDDVVVDLKKEADDIKSMADHHIDAITKSVVDLPKDLANINGKLGQKEEEFDCSSQVVSAGMKVTTDHKTEVEVEPTKEALKENVTQQLEDKSLFQDISKAANESINALGDAAESIAGKITGLFEKTEDLCKEKHEQVVGAVASGIETIQSKMTTVGDDLKVHQEITDEVKDATTAEYSIQSATDVHQVISGKETCKTRDKDQEKEARNISSIVPDSKSDSTETELTKIESDVKNEELSKKTQEDVAVRKLDESSTESSKKSVTNGFDSELSEEASHEKSDFEAQTVSSKLIPEPQTFFNKESTEGKKIDTNIETKSETLNLSNAHEKVQSDQEKMDEKTLKQEEILVDSAQDLEETFETVSDMSKSVVFEKMSSEKKTVESGPSGEELDETDTKEGSKHKVADCVKDSVDEYKEDKISETLLPTKEKGEGKDTADQKVVEAESLILTAASKDVKEDSNDSISDQKQQEVQEKINNQLEESVRDINEKFETVAQSLSSLTFEKGEKINEEQITDKETISQSVDTPKCSDDDSFDIPKEVLKDKEEKLKDSAEDVKETYDELNQLSQSIQFDKCDKADQKNWTDNSKYPVIEPPRISGEDTGKEEVEAPNEMEEQLEKSAEDLGDTYENVAQLSKSVSFEKCEKTSEHKENPKPNDPSAQLEVSVSFEKCDKTGTKGSEVEEMAKALGHTSEEMIKSHESEKDEKETMEKSTKQTAHFVEGNNKTELLVSELENRKLSVSDVEVSLTDERSAVGSVTEDPIGGKSSDQKHITPPTVPVSPNVLEEVKFTSRTDVLIKEVGLRSSTPGSDDSEMPSSHTEPVSERLSRIETPAQSDEDDDQPSMTSQLAHSRESSLCEGELRKPEIDPMGASFPQELPHRTIPEPCHLFELTQAKFTSSSIHEPHRALPSDTMSASFMGDLPGDPTETWGEPLGLPTPAGDGDEFHGEMNLMTASFYGELPSETDDPIRNWGKPLGLPSPAPPSDNKGTPKKERRVPSSVSTKNKLNDEVKKRAESPSKYSRNNKKTTSTTPVYVDLTYVPHHGNTYYACVEFFKRVRARYYVFSGIEPSKEVYDALLEGKQTWEDKELEVTIIPTYDTDILGYWVAENEEILTKLKIDLSPSASRCTINLQDHETSCSAYRLEF